jgi:transcriptional regulator with XRE-family HTH domain
MARKLIIDKDKVIELRRKGLSHQAIADKLGVSKSGITKCINSLPADLFRAASIEEYKENKVSELLDTERRALQILQEALNAMKSSGLSTKQAKDLIDIIQKIDNITRLEQGKATSHIIRETFNDLSEEDKDYFRKMGEQRRLKVVSGGKK